MARVDIKVTAWERVNIKDEFLDIVTEKIISGEIKTTQDIINGGYAEDEDGDYHIIDESEVTMTVEENNGNATIQVYENDDESANPYYQNGH